MLEDRDHQWHIKSTIFYFFSFVFFFFLTASPLVRNKCETRRRSNKLHSKIKSVWHLIGVKCRRILGTDVGEIRITGATPRPGWRSTACRASLPGRSMLLGLHFYGQQSGFEARFFFIFYFYFFGTITHMTTAWKSMSQFKSSVLC